jgi:two-component system phosphate regulon sensor histidine kinase PhoR
MKMFSFFRKPRHPVFSSQDTALNEQVLEATRQKDRVFAILESMAEGVLVLDPDQKILLANSVLSSILNLKKDEILGRYSWELFRDPDLNAMIQDGLRNRVVIRKEHSLLLSESTFEIQISPVFSEEVFLGVVAVFHDVTRLKALEKMRSEFFANVSHEFKTPLTSILGFVETLKEGGIEDSRRRMEFLEIIEEHAKKFNCLIEELLLLSKLESDSAPFEKQELDFGEMLEKLTKLFLPAVKTARVTLKSEIHPKNLRIWAEPKSFERALSNLIDNAVKYNKEGGEILVKAFETAQEARVEVHDTGIGIPQADVARIFERFYRVDKSRDRQSGGTGLGLSIVKHILERHGGRVQVESVLGKGSIFALSIPQNTQNTTEV